MIAVAMDPATVGRTVQLGSGQSHSIAGLVELVGRLLGKDLEVETVDRRVRPEASEVQELMCDPRLARELTGWSPSVSMEEGLRLTAAWIRSDPGRWKIDQYAV
jgi:nucleoside-diphosphate-sugar epimerase